MDPWLFCHSHVTVSEKNTVTKFEDNFSPEIDNKLPDHAEYLAILEEKLRRIKNDPNVLKQLSSKKEACMQQLLNEGTLEYDALEEPVGTNQILRTILPQKQAINQGEVVELLKHDQLSNGNVPQLNTESKENTENRNPQ